MSSGGATLALAAIGADARHPVRRLRPLGRRGRSRWSTSCSPRRCRTRASPSHRSCGRLAGIGDRHGWSGAFNGFFIAFLRLQPIVVTLSTMFIVQGVTLLVMDKPGGRRRPSLERSLSATPSRPPADADPVLVGRRCCRLAWLKRTALRRGASTRSAATRTRRAPPACRRRLVQFWRLCPRRRLLRRSPASSSAPQTGSADPLVGNPLLLQMFAAVVVGGTRARRRARRPLGSMFGAYILMIVVNILLVLNVSAYYSTIAEGSILILAVLAGSLGRALAARRLAPPAAAQAAGTAPGHRYRRASPGEPPRPALPAAGPPRERAACPLARAPRRRRCATRCRPMSASPRSSS